MAWMAQTLPLRLILLVCILLVGGFGCAPAQDLFEDAPAPVPVAAPVVDTVIVEVKGAVRFPGVYEIPHTHRLTHLLEEAGGADAEADLRHVNLAMKLLDGDSFYIPFQGESVGEKDILVQEQVRINVNRATREELMTVPGIGPATADNILAFREERGGFRTMEDLLLVPRIGEKTLEKLRAHLEVR